MTRTTVIVAHVPATPRSIEHWDVVEHDQDGRTTYRVGFDSEISAMTHGYLRLRRLEAVA